MDDGLAPVCVGTGFEVAPGSEDDIHVANAHPWGSWLLVFEGGKAAGSALFIAETSENQSLKGEQCLFFKFNVLVTTNAGTSFESEPFLCDGAKLRAREARDDVLLRMKQQGGDANKA